MTIDRIYKQCFAKMVLTLRRTVLTAACPHPTSGARLRPTLAALSDQKTMAQQRWHRHHNSDHRLSGRRSAGAVERLRQQIIMLAKVVSLCLLAVMFALGLQFDPCDRRGLSHVVVAGATAQGTDIGLPGGVENLSATGCTPLRASSERFLDRHRTGAASRRVSTAAIHTICSPITSTTTTAAAAAAAAAVAAMRFRGEGKIASRHSQRLERRRARTRSSAFVVHVGFSQLHSSSDLRQRKNANALDPQRRLTKFDRTSGDPVSIVATEQPSQRQRQESQWRAFPGNSDLQTGSNDPAQSWSKYYSARWRDAADIAAASPCRPLAAVTARSFRVEEHEQHGNNNSPHYSAWKQSVGRQQKLPQNAAALSSNSVRNHRTALFASSSSCIEEGGGGGSGRKPPLLVTIGPQCCGKTTLLRALASRGSKAVQDDPALGRVAVTTVTDIAIDDYPAVYHKIPVNQLLEGEGTVGGVEEPIVRGRRLNQRLAEPGCREMRLVALRLMGRISADDFGRYFQETGGKASPEAFGALSVALDKVVTEGVEMITPTVDVFVRESLFPAAITSSQHKLEAAARGEGLVAWGNTNTQARDYHGALEQAELTGRPVRFIRWGYELPFLSLEELCRRNVLRLAATGRYIEIAGIETALGRIERLYAATIGGDPIQLALAAGFHMDPSSGRVTSFPTSPPRHRSQTEVSPNRRSKLPKADAVTEGQQRRQRGAMGHRNRATGNTEVRGGGGGGANDEEGAGDEISQTRAARSEGYDIWQKRRDEGKTRAELDGRGSSRVMGSGDGVGAAWAFHVAPTYSPETVCTTVDELTSRCLDNENCGEYRVEAPAFPVPLRLAQEWRVRGGEYPQSRVQLRAGGAMGSASRGMAAEVKPPTVVFGNEWGRKREWRRTDYNENDVDEFMSSCYFKAPVNGTRMLRRNEGDEGSADMEEMELVRRIKSFKEKR